MIKASKNQNGFSVIELIVAAGILGLLSFAGYVIYKNHHKTTAQVATGHVTGKWAAYSNEAGGFSVLSPTPSYQPTIFPQSTHSDNGTTVTLNALSFNDSDGQYEIVYVTFPSSDKVPNYSLYIKNLLQTSKYQKDARLVSSKFTTIDGHQAEAYTMTATVQNLQTGNGETLPSFKAFNTGELIRDGKVMYEVYASLGDNTVNDQANAQYFVNSFKLER